MIKKFGELFEAKRVKSKESKTLDSISEKTESLKFKDSILHIFHDLDLPSNFSIEEGYVLMSQNHSEQSGEITSGPFHSKGCGSSGEDIDHINWGSEDHSIFGIDRLHKYSLDNKEKIYYCISITSIIDEDDSEESDFDGDPFNLESTQFKIKQLDFNKNILVGLVRSFKMCPDLSILKFKHRGESVENHGFDIIFC